jgi:hypothetical protein
LESFCCRRQDTGLGRLVWIQDACVGFFNWITDAGVGIGIGLANPGLVGGKSDACVGWWTRWWSDSCSTGRNCTDTGSCVG